MAAKLLILSEGLMEHIRSFEVAFKCKSNMDAIRQLILAGCIYYGSPYTEIPEERVKSPGRPKYKKEPEQSVGKSAEELAAQFDTPYYRSLFNLYKNEETGEYEYIKDVNTEE